MDTNIIKYSFQKSVDKPVPEQFWAMADYEKYSAAIWQILIEVMEKDLATIGKYGVGYDQKMKNRIEGTANLVLAFRHYGLINASSKSGQRVKQLYDKSNK